MEATDKLKKYLISKDVPKMVDAFNVLYSSISNLEYSASERTNQIESFYHGVLHAYLKGAQAHVVSEVHGNLGRVDLLARFGDRSYVIELKLAKKSNQLKAAAEDGFRQILEKNYGGAHPGAIPISIAVDSRERRIGYYVYELEGRTSVIDLRKPKPADDETEKASKPRRRRKT
jgi:predicted RecB family nuclease